MTNQKPCRRTFLTALVLSAAASVAKGAVTDKGAARKHDDEEYNAGWLRKACLAFEVAEDDAANLTKDQENRGILLSALLAGVICGMGLSMVIVATHTGANPDPFLVPTDEMTDTKKCALSLGKFLRDKRMEIPDSADFANVLIAWYFSAHPKAQKVDAAMVDLILKGMKESKK